MNLYRTIVIAINVFREVIRDRVLYLIALFAIGFFIAARLLPALSASTQNQITLDVGLAGMNLLGLLIAIFVGTGLVNKEIEKKTVSVLIAKPISRAEFIVGKHLGLSAVLAVLMLSMLIVYLFVVWFQGIPTPVGSLIIAVLFQILELSLVTAVAILFGVFTSSLLATLLTLAVYLMGQLSRDLLSFAQLIQNATIEFFSRGLYLILPDLSRLNLKNQAVYGMELLPTSSELLSNALYAIVYIGLLLALATFIFSRRQF
ncbi:MAG: ABC transporter permease subunit [Synechococcales bacterium]|nr:ABC transporter permease subunit [Synechococcales bacterium]